MPIIEIWPLPRPREPTNLSVVIVASEPILPPTMDIERGQVESEMTLVLQQVVGQLKFQITF
jgi:hypothetical protein